MSLIHRFYVQCRSLRCCPQHGGWRWQPLITQVPASKSKADPCCMVAYNWVKLQRKIITFLITWDVGKVVLHPHISGIILGNVHLHGLIKFPKYSQFYTWYLLSILLMFGSSSLHTLYFSSAPIDKNRKPSYIRRLESKYWMWNWLYFGNLINPFKCTFPKKMREMCGWRRTFPTSRVIRYNIIFLCNNITQL